MVNLAADPNELADNLMAMIRAQDASAARSLKRKVADARGGNTDTTLTLTPREVLVLRAIMSV